METFTLTVGSYSKAYPIVPAPSNESIRIVFMTDLPDNVALHRAASPILAKQISEKFPNVDAIVVPGDAVNALAALLVDRLCAALGRDIDLIVFRGTAKGGPALSTTYQSITGTHVRALHARSDHLERLKGKNVVLFDEIVSSGATMRAALELATKAGAGVLGVACIATEGDERADFEGLPLDRMLHLPVFIDN